MAGMVRVLRGSTSQPPAEQKSGNFLADHNIIDLDACWRHII